MSALPYLREAVASAPADHGMAEMMAMLPVAVAQRFIAFKVLVALVAFAVLIGLARHDSGRTLYARLRATPLSKSMLAGGAALATALSAFDLCTGFHATAMDANGDCHCWTTGLVAFAGALLFGLSIAWSRALAAFVRDVVRAIVALATRGRSAHGFTAARRWFVYAFRYLNLVRRRCAGRAPPLFPFGRPRLATR
jgi:hypothetical protein